MLIVVNIQKKLSQTRGLHEVIMMDNRPEFTGKHIDEWTYRYGVKLNFI